MQINSLIYRRNFRTLFEMQKWFKNLIAWDRLVSYRRNRDKEDIELNFKTGPSRNRIGKS